MDASTATASSSGPRRTSRGCVASACPTRSPSRRSSRCSATSTASTASSRGSTATSSRSAATGRWREQVLALTAFRGISTKTALGLIAEIGDFRRFGHPRELASWLGITPSEYSSGDQQHRGHITKTGNRHARRLLVETAWHYRHRPRRPTRGPDPTDRAWQAQIRLHHRHHDLIGRGKRTTVVNVAIARELVGFLWAEMTGQLHRQEAAA